MPRLLFTPALAATAALLFAAAASAGPTINLQGTQTYSTDVTVGGSTTGAINFNTAGGSSADVLTLDNAFWDGGIAGGTKSEWTIGNGAKILVGANYKINNNQPDMVNARTFQVEGLTGNEVVEFAPGFNADHTGYTPGMTRDANIAFYGGDGAWDDFGLSTIRIGNATMVTHATQNLATIHKLGPDAGDTVHTHHGLIVFDISPAAWRVKTSDQVYDGGLIWNQAWTLDAETDLLIGVNTYEERHKVTFGTRGSTGQTLTKTGAGTLRVEMTQAHGPGSAIDIQQGRVEFASNAGVQPAIYSNWNWPASNAGQHLSINVGAAGTMSFEVDNAIADLTSAGRTEVFAGATVSTTGGIVLSNGSTLATTLSTSTAPLGGPALDAGGNLTVDGHHEVSLAGPRSDLSNGDTFVVASYAGSRSGTFDSVTPRDVLGIDFSHAYDNAAKQVRLAVDKLYLAGDANFDDVVNFSDFLQLQAGFGAAGVWADGDFDVSGLVDFSDFLQLQANFGTSLSGAPVFVSDEQWAALAAFAAAHDPVPEPGTLAVVALAGLGLVAGRRRSRA